MGRPPSLPMNSQFLRPTTGPNTRDNLGDARVERGEDRLPAVKAGLTNRSLTTERLDRQPGLNLFSEQRSPMGQALWIVIRHEHGPP